MRGIPRRFGNFSLRDLVPSGAFRRARPKRQRSMQSQATLPDDTSPSTDHSVPDHHVLDYRTLDSLRLVFGETYADH